MSGPNVVDSLGDPGPARIFSAALGWVQRRPEVTGLCGFLSAGPLGERWLCLRLRSSLPGGRESVAWNVFFDVAGHVPIRCKRWVAGILDRAFSRAVSEATGFEPVKKQGGRRARSRKGGGA